VQHGPNGTFAYVVGKDETAQVRPIEVLATQGDLAVIKTGVAPGDHVVIEGQAQIRPGARVSPKPAGSGR